MGWLKLGVAALAVLGLHSGSAAAAGTSPDIRVAEPNVYSESITADRAGNVYMGSVTGTIFRARRGAAVAEPWIRATAQNGLLAVMGVLADGRSKTLWACSAAMPFTVPPRVGTSSLAAFDLKTGAFKRGWPLPAPASTCNDVTIDRTGAAFVADTPNGRIFRLTPGARSLEPFAQDARLRGIDGIVFGADGSLYVNNVQTNQLLRVDRAADGSFAGLTNLALSQPIAGPDGFRLIPGGRFLLSEGNSGKVSVVTIKGDTAEIRTIHDKLASVPGVTLTGSTVYALEGKIGYLVDPKLKGQDPGPFFARAFPLEPVR